jgi:outer membrane protein
MSRLFRVMMFAVAAALAAQAQSAPVTTKVGIINIQSAIVSTKDGQKAANEIQSRFMPKKTDLEKKQTEISELQDKLNKGRNTLSEEARQGLVREIDTKTKALSRSTEDAQAEFDQEQQKIMNELGGKILAVIDKYAKENGYSVILDVSSQQTPVLYASSNIDITKDIVELYDKNLPAMTTPGSTSSVPRPPAAAPAKRPATAPTPAAPK